MYIIRLDDAAIKRNIKNWDKMEELLTKHDIKPIVGVIPNCKDPDFEIYEDDVNFIERIHTWEQKGWHIAIHGYDHVFQTNNSGINPVNNKSEFAGLTLQQQREKIRQAMEFFRSIQIEPNIFFPPAHTFDKNTLEAIKLETNINIISDTIANDIYYKEGLYFIPCQSGGVRKLPFKTVTFCYHPNNMQTIDFEKLEEFIIKNKKAFGGIELKKKKRTLYDWLLEKTYFSIRKIRRILR